MKKRTIEASKAIAKAWEMERELVLKGKGTRDWSIEQQQDILKTGKAHDADGKSFEGHHMKSVSKFPDMQGNPNNIQFLSRTEHLEAHGGSFQNPTSGRYDPILKQTKEILSNNDLREVIPLSRQLTIKNNYKNKTSQNKFGVIRRATKKVKIFYQNNKPIVDTVIKTVVIPTALAVTGSKIKKKISNKNISIIKPNISNPVEYSVDKYLAHRGKDKHLANISGYKATRRK